jgi:hypothetical protein
MCGENFRGPKNLLSLAFYTTGFDMLLEKYHVFRCCCCYDAICAYFVARNTPVRGMDVCTC